MSTGTAIGLVISFIALIVTVVLYSNDQVDKKIESKLKDQEFLQTIASHVRLPFIIFNENEEVLNSVPQESYDNYINKITVTKTDVGTIKEVCEVVVSPKNYLSHPPILECLDAHIEFYEAKRTNNIDLVYRSKIMKHPYMQTTEIEGELSVQRFKITIIP